MTLVRLNITLFGPNITLVRLNITLVSLNNAVSVRINDGNGTTILLKYLQSAVCILPSVCCCVARVASEQQYIQ